MNAIIISETGKINGRGSMPHRWVSGLTKSEREAVKRGETVLVPDNNPHPMCTEYKQVTYYRGRYGHKNYYSK